MAEYNETEDDLLTKYTPTFILVKAYSSLVTS
jgi:hypothetical protein